MVLPDIHCRIGLAVTFFAFALGVWGVIGYLRHTGVTGSYFGALVIGEILVIGQALVGVALLFTGTFPVDALHFIYGVTVPLTWAAVYVYTRGQQSQREMLIYGVVSFFVMGLAIRAIMTGGTMPSCLSF